MYFYPLINVFIGSLIQTNHLPQTRLTFIDNRYNILEQNLEATRNLLKFRTEKQKIIEVASVNSSPRQVDEIRYAAELPQVIALKLVGIFRVK